MSIEEQELVKNIAGFSKNYDKDLKYEKAATVRSGKNEQKKYSKLEKFLFWSSINQKFKSSSKLRRKLYTEIRRKGFIIYEEVKGIIFDFQKVRNNFTTCSKKVPNSLYMSKQFLCKCEWLLYNPVTLPCGHTFCKECADEAMFCLVCGITLDRPCPVNIFLVAILSNWFPNEYKATELKKIAKNQMKNNSLLLALSSVNKALLLVAEDYIGLNLRSEIYTRLQRYSEAFRDVELACKINHCDAKLQFQRGVCYSNLGNLESAIDAFQLCLELEPENMELSNAVISRIDELLSLPDSEEKNNLPNEFDRDSLLDQDCGDKGSTKPSTYTGHDNSTKFDNTAKTYSTTNSRTHIQDELVSNSISDCAVVVSQQKSPKSNCVNSKYTLTSNCNEKSDKNSFSENCEILNNRLSDLIEKPSCSKGGKEKKMLSHDNISHIELISKHQNKPVEKFLGVPKHALKEEDFECKLCYDIIYNPVTAPCGHVFCRHCLLRTLDHNTLCPICRECLKDYLGKPSKPVTEIIVKMLERYFNKEYSERKKTYMDNLEKLSRVGIDKDVPIPIFVCSIAFPYVGCPLHIFEPKYRLMIRNCLESGSKKFGMCIPQSPQSENGDFADIGTICEITKYKVLPDGRFIIHTVAGQRFLVKEKRIVDSLYYADVNYFCDEPEDLSHERFSLLSTSIYNQLLAYITDLKSAEQNCIFNALGRLPPYTQNYGQYQHGVPWIWWGLAALPLNLTTKLVFLRSKCVSERMLSLQRFLRFLTNLNNASNNSTAGTR